MKGELKLLALGVTTFLIVGFGVNAQSLESANVTKAKAQAKSTDSIFVPYDNGGESYITVTRATGEVETYILGSELEEFNSVLSTDANTTADEILIPKDVSIAIGPEPLGVQPRDTSHSFDWNIKGGYIGYSTVQLDLKKGDNITYSIATKIGYSCNVGIYDNTNKEFHSAYYHGGTEGAAFVGAFMLGEDISSASFAIKNLRTDTTNFSGSYTSP